MSGPRYSREPEDAREFTRRFDRTYTRIAGVYDAAVRHLPVWKTWLAATLPHVQGPRVLEVSFGTGWLLTRTTDGLEVHGLDLNRRMVETARANLARTGRRAELVCGDVEHLPYPDAAFDCLVNTMAFSGYPDARRALAEMRRVLRPGGRLVLLDVGFPADGNRVGTWLAEGWKLAGDLVRDVDALLDEYGFEPCRQEIGGRGSVQLWVATRPDA